MNKNLLPLLFAFLGRGRSVGSWIMIATFVVIYLLVQPVLNQKLGLKLPGLFGGSSSQPALASTSTENGSTPTVVTASDRNDGTTSQVAMGDLVIRPKAPSKSEPTASGKSVSSPKESPAAKPTSKPTGNPNREGTSGNQSTTTKPSGSSTSSGKTDTETGKPQAPLGKLTEVGPKVFETTAGLRYGPGSVDGHRLLHIMEHAKDRPDKPVHGVFEGDEYTIRAMIDEAYLIAELRGPPQAKKEVEGERTIWKVDMKRKIGYLGGETGKRKGKPALTGIQLVLEGANVITAYPIDPRR